MRICFLTALLAGSDQPFTGANFSGTCECKGQDGHEGPYTSTVTLQLIKERRQVRRLLAAANDRPAAIYFALTDPAPSTESCTQQ